MNDSQWFSLMVVILGAMPLAMIASYTAVLKIGDCLTNAKLRHQRRLPASNVKHYRSNPKALSPSQIADMHAVYIKSR